MTREGTNLTCLGCVLQWHLWNILCNTLCCIECWHQAIFLIILIRSWLRNSIGVNIYRVVAVQLLNHNQLFVTPWTAAFQAPLILPSPRVCSNSCPVSQWCYLTISSSPAPFSFCVQSLPASGSFLMSWLFASDGQSIRASASASASASNEYSDLISFRIYWLDFLAVQGTLKSLLQKHSAKVSIL